MQVIETNPKSTVLRLEQDLANNNDAFSLHIFEFWMIYLLPTIHRIDKVLP